MNSETVNCHECTSEINTMTDTYSWRDEDRHTEYYCLDCKPNPPYQTSVPKVPEDIANFGAICSGCGEIYEHIELYQDYHGLWCPGCKLPTGADPKQAAGDKKCPMQLIPTEAERLMAEALSCGAKKYKVYNWRKGDGVEAMVYVGAIKRHLAQFVDGEDSDEESGICHLGHIMAGCAILVDARRTNKLIDNRPKIHAK